MKKLDPDMQQVRREAVAEARKNRENWMSGELRLSGVQVAHVTDTVPYWKMRSGDIEVTERTFDTALLNLLIRQQREIEQQHKEK